MVMHNYAAMPAETANNLYLLYPKEEKSEQKEAQDADSERDNNILLEKKYLSTYWHYFRVSIGVQGVMATTLTYGVGSVFLGKFNGSVMRSFCGVGIVLHMYALYLKRIKMDDI